jgi:hypothetical protein
MSQTYDNTNRGAIFKNDKKTTDNHPDYTGKLDVDGAEYWVSAWIKTGKSGKFMSLSVKPRDEKRHKMAPVKQAPATDPIFEDDADLPPF